MGVFLEESGQVKGHPAALHRVQQDHHHPQRSPERFVLEHPCQQRGGLRGDKEIYFLDLSGSGKDCEAVQREGSDLRPLRGHKADQELIRQGGADEAGSLSGHRDDRGPQRDRCEQRHPLQDRQPGGELLRGQQDRCRGDRTATQAQGYGRNRDRGFHRHGFR